MTCTAFDKALIAAIQDGLPLSPTPYLDIARRIGVTEDDVITRISELAETGVFSRIGVIVRHHELGYRANAMVVWDVSDERVAEAGRQLARLPFVTLSYRRPRSLPNWPFNLFCMIHGKCREAVEEFVAEATVAADLGAAPNAILFSGRRFKQRGAHYVPAPAAAAE